MSYESPEYTKRYWGVAAILVFGAVALAFTIGMFILQTSGEDNRVREAEVELCGKTKDPIACLDTIKN